MTYEEYKVERKKLQEETNSKFKELALKYAKANNPYKIGDIITDHCQTIKIEKIQCPVIGIFNSTKPYMVYSGPAYTKKLEPKKSKEHGTVYQENIKSSIIH